MICDSVGQHSDELHFLWFHMNNEEPRLLFMSVPAQSSCRFSPFVWLRLRKVSAQKRMAHLNLVVRVPSQQRKLHFQRRHVLETFLWVQASLPHCDCESTSLHHTGSLATFMSCYWSRTLPATVRGQRSFPAVIGCSSLCLLRT